MRSSLHNYLRSHRKQCQLSQRELAFLLGLTSQGVVSQHESLARLPQLKILIKYEVLFNKPAGQLYPKLRREAEKEIGTKLRIITRRLERQGGASARRKLEYLALIKERLDIRS